MPKNSNLTWNSAKIRDPRVVMRVIIGALLLGNLAAAIIAFKPFGGSAEDLRSQAASLRAKLTRAQNQLADSKKMVEKVQHARAEGDQFMTKYVTDQRVWSSTIQAELNRLATEAGIKAGQQSYSEEQVEGSESISMLTITAGFEGSYANLAKLMNLIDRSPRFLIVENMTATAPQVQPGNGPQQQQGERPLNVTLRIDTFMREEGGSAL